MSVATEESDIEADVDGSAFGDEFDEEMDNFWKDEKPDQDEIDNFFEEDDDEEGGVEGLSNLDKDETGQILDEEEAEDDARLAEEVAALQAKLEEEEKNAKKIILDRDNVDKLINMVSRVRLAWPEDLPGYDAMEYGTDPERSKFRESYFHNTDKEKTVLWHAENFRRQFQKLYPTRRALVIAPKNECGTQKLFPTYINPCVLGYPEFLEASTTAEYFKEFFAPALMEHPTRWPDRVRSHLTVLKERNATCFEYAIIMVSFLIGAGYDAYVVDGYASEGVTTMDATEDYGDLPDGPDAEELAALQLQNPPKRKSSTDKIKDKSDLSSGGGSAESRMDFLSHLFQEEEEVQKIRPVSPSKYRFKKCIVGVCEPEGDSDIEDTSTQDQATSDPYQDHDQDETTTEPVDALPKPGKHRHEHDDEEEVSDTEEEEETQEEHDHPEKEPGDEEDDDEEEEEHHDHEELKHLHEEYEGEEEEEPVRIKRKRPSCLPKHYGTRTHAWVLVKEGKRGVEIPFFIEPFSASILSLDDESFFGVESVFNNRNFWVSLDDPMDFFARDLDYDLDKPDKWGKLLVEAEKKKKPTTAEGELNQSMLQDDEDDQPKPIELLLDMPISFTPDPEISQEEYERRYPGGKKDFKYNNAIVELAAPYVNDDGLVRKLLKFHGTGRDPDDLEFIEEKFENRRDKLARIKWTREDRILHEYFHRGRKDALKEHVHISGKNRPNYPRDLYYYANAHPQGVSHRQILRKGMVELFEGRDDLLYYRFTSYGPVICDPLAPKKKKKKKKRVSGAGDEEEEEETEEEDDDEEVEEAEAMEEVEEEGDDDEEEEEGDGEPLSKSKAKRFLELLKGNNSGEGRVRRKISKIIEKYHRDPSKDVSDDIAEKHMLIDEGRLRIMFHYGVGNLTRDTIEFFKPKGSNPDTADFHPEDCIEYLADPHAPPSDVYHRFKLLQRLEADQRVASVLAAQAEEEVFETVTGRVQEDFRHEIEPDAFAGERNEEYMKLKEAKIVEDEDGDEDLSDVDFTSPFFERFGVPRNKAEEVLMKKRIMLNAKIRLVKKAHAIRENFEIESASLSEKMRWYDRHVDKMNASQEEEFLRLYKERLFEMHVMEKRLTRHQQLASEEYYKTLLKVLKHPLLNRFSNKKIPPPSPPPPGMTDSEKARLAALALKLKDCCQFYTVKYVEPKKGAKQKQSNLVSPFAMADNQPQATDEEETAPPPPEDDEEEGEDALSQEKEGPEEKEEKRESTGMERTWEPPKPNDKLCICKYSDSIIPKK